MMSASMNVRRALLLLGTAALLSACGKQDDSAAAMQLPPHRARNLPPPIRSRVAVTSSRPPTAPPATPRPMVRRSPAA